MHVKEPTSFIRKELGNNPGVVVRQAKQAAIYSGGEAYIQAPAMDHISFKLTATRLE